MLCSVCLAEIDWVSSLAEAKAMSAKSGKPILIFAATPTCPYCVMMKEGVFTDTAVEKEIKERFVTYLAYPVAGAYPKDAGIHGVPTLLFYDAKERKIVPNIVGLQTPDELVKKLKEIKK